MVPPMLPPGRDVTSLHEASPEAAADGDSVSHLDANLAAIAAHDAVLARRLRLPVGSAQVRDGDDGLERQHRRAWRRLRLGADEVAGFEAAAAGHPHVLAFGVGDGGHVVSRLRLRADARVTVWDRDPELLRRFLDAFDLVEVIAAGRLAVALTTDLVALVGDPATAFWAHPTARVQYVEEWRIVEAGAAATAPWALVVSGGLFVDDLEDALRDEGYRVFPLDATVLAPEEMSGHVRALRPRVVAAINYKNGLAEFCAAEGVPLVSWEIDPTTDRVAPLASKAPGAHIFTYRAAQVAEFEGAGFTHVEYLPLASNPERRAPPAADADDEKNYGVPVAFVGASLRDQVDKHYLSLVKIVEAARGRGGGVLADFDRRLGGILEAQSQDFSRYLIPELWPRFFGDFGLPTGGPGEDPMQLVAEIAAADKRLAYVAMLADRGVHVWGDEGFAPIAELGVQYRGPAGHFHELNKIYGHARINVDIGRLYQSDIVTMRVFDVLACGGFVLTEWNEALAALFDVGREIETYRTVDEMLAKVDHYAAHPGEARAIAERGRARVLRDHTIRARVQYMLRTVFAHDGSAKPSPTPAVAAVPRLAGPSAEARPTLSFCVPTFNRARYLRSLLTMLEDGLRTFPHTFEVVIGDNASTDDTHAVVESFAGRLPLRSVRHAENRGPYANLFSTYERARGEFLVYVADDDMIDPSALSAIVTAMERDPSVGVTYAPWLVHDLVEGKSHGPFYEQPSDVRIRRRDHRALLDHLLRSRAFPEIGVLRASMWRKRRPRVYASAYWSFAHVTEYLHEADVAFASRPYYISISRYFPDDDRAQLGLQEASAGWDSYRGGLETVLAHAAVDERDRQGCLRRIDEMVAIRIEVAIRLRTQKDADAIECYLLAQRGRALGIERHLALPMRAFALRAGYWHLVHDAELRYAYPAVVCVDALPEGHASFLERIGGGRVSFPAGPLDLTTLRDCVAYFRTAPRFDAAAAAALEAANVLVVTEADLLDRFPP